MENCEIGSKISTKYLYQKRQNDFSNTQDCDVTEIVTEEIEPDDNQDESDCIIVSSCDAEVMELSDEIEHEKEKKGDDDFASPWSEMSSITMNLKVT